MADSIAELLRFRDDTYGFRYLNYVSLFIVTDEGVVVCDACGQGNARTPYLIKEAVRSVTEQPVRYLVYSHSALDHATGAAAFADTARFVGHTRTAERLREAHEPTTPPPDLTFDEKLTLELGGKQIDLYAADISAVDDYIVLHYPAGRIAMLVDFVQPRTIPFRYLLGHPDAIIERLRWFQDNLEFDTFLSGHATGEWVSGTKQDLEEQRQYYLDLSAAIDTARAAGLTDASAEMKALVRSMLAPRYGSWRRFDTEFQALNVEGMIAWRAAKTFYPL